MSDINWKKMSKEMDDIISMRYEQMDVLDNRIGIADGDCPDNKILKLRKALVEGYSKTKTIWKNYGAKAAIHNVYDYVMAKTYYHFKEGRNNGQ